LRWLENKFKYRSDWTSYSQYQEYIKYLTTYYRKKRPKCIITQTCKGKYVNFINVTLITVDFAVILRENNYGNKLTTQWVAYKTHFNGEDWTDVEITWAHKKMLKQLWSLRVKGLLGWLFQRMKYISLDLSALHRNHGTITLAQLESKAAEYDYRYVCHILMFCKFGPQIITSHNARKKNFTCYRNRCLKTEF